MPYLGSSPLAVCGAVAIAALIQAGRQLGFWWRPACAGLLIAVFSVFAATHPPRAAPVITKPILRAGIWTREHAPAACVDYLVSNGYTAYWLHLAVLRTPRSTARMDDPDTLGPPKALIRWIYPS